MKMTTTFYDLLRAAPSAWKGESILQDPTTGQPEVSQASARFTPMLRGSFLRLDYTWAYQGSPEEGSMWIGHDPDTGLYALHWADTWHMSRKIMVCEGREEPGGQKLVVRGTWTADGDGDRPPETWGWRIEISLQSGGPETKLEILMYNVSPAGVGELAVTTSLKAYAP